jgi:hypothetical protein
LVSPDLFFIVFIIQRRIQGLFKNGTDSLVISADSIFITKEGDSSLGDTPKGAEAGAPSLRGEKI